MIEEMPQFEGLPEPTPDGTGFNTAPAIVPFDRGPAPMQKVFTPQVAMIDRPLPSNLDAEALVLGAVFVDNAMMSVAERKLRPEDFYSPYHQVIFEAMISLYYKKDIVDPIKVVTELTRLGHNTEAFGGIARVAKLLVGVPTFNEEGIKSHIEDIIERSVARDLTKFSNVLISESLNPSTDTRATLAEARSKIEALTAKLDNINSSERIGFYSLAEIVPDLAEQFTNYHEGITNGVSTGMEPLDHMLDGGGLQTKASYLIAGGEKTGKTSLALDWVTHISVIQKKLSLAITAEMHRTTLAKRIYSFHSGIPFFQFRPGFHDTGHDKAFTRAMQGLGEFGDIPIHIADNLRTWGQMREHIARKVDACRSGKIRDKNGDPIDFGVAMVDYLQLIELDGAMATSKRVDVVSTISRNVKITASELDIPIVTMSSLNRMGLTEGQVPDTFNLRDSGTIAFDAEAVMFIYNPAYVPGQKYEPREITDMDLILSRQRNGPTGTIPLKFIGKYMQFMTAVEFDKRFSNASVADGGPEETNEDEDFDSLWNEQ